MQLTESWFQQVIDREVEGVELVVLEEAGTKRERILRLYIDHPNGVTHELCARVSAAIGDALDESGSMNEGYRLEVSSPGIERPLRKRSHFEAQVGKTVYVKSRTPVEGRKVWQGTLVEVGPDEIVVEEAGKKVEIPLGEIANAHLKYEFR